MKPKRFIKSLTKKELQEIEKLFRKGRNSRALGDNWPQFRGPGGSGISREIGLPET